MFLEGQALLYEFADCLAVQTFLHMADLPVQPRQRPNADFISLNGILGDPELRHGDSKLIQEKPWEMKSL